MALHEAFNGSIVVRAIRCSANRAMQPAGAVALSTDTASRIEDWMTERGDLPASGHEVDEISGLKVLIDDRLNLGEFRLYHEL